MCKGKRGRIRDVGHVVSVPPSRILKSNKKVVTFL